MSFNRRRFLSWAGSASLLANTQTLWANAPAPRRKLGVALVGLGSYSQGQLAPALQLTSHCELRGIVTGSPDKIPRWQQQYGIKDSNVYSYETMHEIANNPDIDVVYVVVPTSLHKKYTLIAANAGKHVWCEKPMALTADDCQIMIDTCARNKVQLAIGYRLQHEPNTRTLMQYAKQRPFGAIKQVVARAGYKGGAPSADDWRIQKAMGGGAMYDMGVYPLNAARYTTGEEPIAVTARHKIYRPKTFSEVDEATFFELEFPSGARAECATSVYESMNTLRADCENGWYKLEPFQSYSGVRGETSDGTQLVKTVEHQQARQMDDDALAIINQVEPLVPGIEGQKDIRIVEAIFESAKNQSRRVLI
ncbi:Gfo/Idh/MocA family protein [Arenicella xantha]|uniref:Glucose-fructose oxidoreductase n=1 Tax=Arenicella xantha TaxID=644221 RepID=A0A395JS87_9GAMM|nr:Gfo/Idh/MocA family oxidoreductase [Arenicella xantha]RBP53202.1 glucose-fructose oxidoreductase [Arenicella xantha]